MQLTKKPLGKFHQSPTDGEPVHINISSDYATYLNLKNNKTSTEPLYDYKMVGGTGQFASYSLIDQKT